jgi:hypothetical protein
MKKGSDGRSDQLQSEEEGAGADEDKQDSD